MIIKLQYPKIDVKMEKLKDQTYLKIYKKKEIWIKY